MSIFRGSFLGSSGGGSGATGPQGPAGPQGDTGPAGAAGATGPQGAVYTNLDGGNASSVHAIPATPIDGGGA